MKIVLLLLVAAFFANESMGYIVKLKLDTNKQTAKALSAINNAIKAFSEHEVWLKSIQTELDKEDTANIPKYTNEDKEKWLAFLTKQSDNLKANVDEDVKTQIDKFYEPIQNAIKLDTDKRTIHDSITRKNTGFEALKNSILENMKNKHQLLIDIKIKNDGIKDFSPKADFSQHCPMVFKQSAAAAASESPIICFKKTDDDRSCEAPDSDFTKPISHFAEGAREAKEIEFDSSSQSENDKSLAAKLNQLSATNMFKSCTYVVDSDGKVRYVLDISNITGRRRELI